MFANRDARLSILGEWFLAADEHSLCLPAASAAVWLSGTIYFILGRFWDSEQSQANHRSQQFSGNPMQIFYIFVLHINSEAVHWENNTFKVLVHPRCVILILHHPPSCFILGGWIFVRLLGRSSDCLGRNSDSSVTAWSFRSVPVPVTACHEDGTVGACVWRAKEDDVETE